MSGPGSEGLPKPPPDAYAKALELLVRREHSRRELKRKLQMRGVDGTLADEAIDKLRGQGFQDDERFAASLARSRAMSGYGPIHIRAELRTHGLSEAMIQLAVDGCEVDWLRNARDLVSRRYCPADLAEPITRRKAAELLLRRGFDFDAVRAATHFDPDDADHETNSSCPDDGF